MGTPVTRREDIPDALRETQQRLWRQPMEPVLTVWENGIYSGFDLHLPDQLIGSSLNATLVLEDGEKKNQVWRIDESMSPIKDRGTDKIYYRPSVSAGQIASGVSPPAARFTGSNYRYAGYFSTNASPSSAVING